MLIDASLTFFFIFFITREQSADSLSSNEIRVKEVVFEEWLRGLALSSLFASIILISRRQLYSFVTKRINWTGVCDEGMGKNQSWKISKKIVRHACAELLKIKSRTKLVETFLAAEDIELISREKMKFRETKNDRRSVLF